MQAIEFEDIPAPVYEQFEKCFSILKTSKSRMHFNPEEIWSVLPSDVQNNFVRLERGDSISEEWDFLSWVDAVESSSIEYHSLEYISEGNGKLNFEQLSWPSGGLEATEELVKVFGGKIRSNNAT